MEFLLKKIQGRLVNTATLDQVKEQLGWDDFNKDIKTLKKELISLKKLPETKDIEKLFNKKFIEAEKILNITKAASIEKDNKIKPGTIYFNVKLDAIRLKKKLGWVTLNTD